MPAIAVGALLTGAISVGVTAATAGIAAVTLATFATPALITLGVGLISRALAPKPPRFAGIDAAAVDPVTSATRGAAERTINSAITPARWIVGTVRCTGRIVWVRVDDDEEVVNMDTRRDTVSSLHMAMVLSQDSCNGIKEIWLDGSQLTVTKSTENGHSVYKADGFELHEYFKADGTEGEECFTAATGADLSFSASDVSAEGLSWCYVKLTQNDYGNDLETRRYNKVPNIEFVVEGIKISSGRDPSGAKSYTENAAIVRKWWLTERRGFNFNKINRTYYRAAVTRCNTMIDISNLTNFDSSAMSTDLARYTINGLIHSGDDVTRVEQDMDFAWDGAVVDWDGELLFRPGGQRSSVKEITGEDIVEEPLYRPGTTLNANRYVCDIPQSEWHDYLPYTLTVDDSGKQTYDGKVQTVNLGRTDLVSNPAQAANLLRSAARRSRASSSLEITVMPGDNFENASILPGDKVTINIPEISLVDAEFFVMDTRVLAGWSIKLVLVEWGSDWYDDSFSLEHYSPRKVLTTGALSAPAPVTLTIAAAQNQDGTFVWFALLTMPTSVWQYNIRYKHDSVSTDDWQEARTASNQITVQLNAAGNWTFEVRSESRDGRQSPANTVKGTAGFDISLPPDPVLARKTIENGFVRYVFNNLGEFVNGLELAYTYADIGDTAPGLLADTAAFEAATQLGQYVIVPAKTLTDERTIVDSLPSIGQYNLYVRARDIAGRYSDIVGLGLETLRLDAPQNVDVDELGDGTRQYSWTLAYNEHVSGAVIRYKRAGDFVPTPGPIENAPPTIIAANVTSDGDVVLAYSEPLDVDSVPARGRYTVSVDGTNQTPSAVGVESNKVTLTLTTKITVSEAVTVSYRVPNNNALQDTHDEKAAALTGHTVNNILRDSGSQPGWSSMEKLHDGYLTSSPYLIKTPGAGIWDIAFRSISRSGRLSEAITYIQVSLGEPVQLDIAEAVKKAIADNPSLITLTSEVEAAQKARDRAITAAQEGEAFRDSAETFKNAAETAKTAAEQASTNVATALTATQKARQDASDFADTAEAEALKSADSASAAAGSATAAAGSATTSMNQATASGRSATASAGSATASAASATAAQRSATAAATSASTATTKATEAGTEAEAARTERVKAEAAKADSESAKDDSETARAAAESAETAAVSAKNAAESAESAATTQASNSASSATASGRSATASANSASTAATKATEASQSASAAETAQTRAETARSGAETAESNAASSATDADGSAKAAASSASGVKANADAAKSAKDDAESAKDDAETAEGNAADSATASANSAKAAKASADAASTDASAVSSERVKAETARSGAETAETNAASSASDADDSATAAAASESAVAANAKTAKDNADAAVAASSTATAKASEASTSATAAETAKTAAETANSSAGTAATNSATSATNADGSATAAATSASAAAVSAATATAQAAASSASATTASAKATEAAESASAAKVSETTAATSEANAATSETNAAASLTSANTAAATAKLEQEAAAGFAQSARTAVAGISQQVSVEVNKSLQTTYASIVSLRAIAGEAKAKFELVALSDPTGARAAGVMTGDLQSFNYAPAGGTVAGAYGRVVVSGLTLQGRNVRDNDNGHTFRILKARNTSRPQPNNKISVSAGTGSSGTTTITLTDNSNNDTVSFNLSTIAAAVTSASSVFRCSGSGSLEVDFTQSSNTVASGTVAGGRDNANSTGGTGWIIRRNGSAEFDAASIRGKIKASQLEAIEADIELADITNLSSLTINANQITAGTIAAARVDADNLRSWRRLYSGKSTRWDASTRTVTITTGDNTGYDAFSLSVSIDAGVDQAWVGTVVIPRASVHINFLGGGGHAAEIRVSSTSISFSYHSGRFGANCRQIWGINH